MNNKDSKIRSLVFVLFVSMFLVVSGCSADEPATQSTNDSNAGKTVESAKNTHQSGEDQDDSLDSEFKNISANDKLEIHFIDVGQADAVLIKGPKDQNIMIDAGNNGDSDLVVDYIKNQGVNKFKAVIGTHPHEDHIGGLDAVINNFDIEKVYMPKVLHTTKTFEDVVDAIDSKELKITTAEKGTEIDLKGMEAVFIGPVGSDYKELNNYSAVLKVAFGNNSFLFQGDAEDLSETEILNSDLSSEIKADVLKVGHHGSHSSTVSEYLKKVDPKYAVIMVGKDNDYGHPHKEVMNRLEKDNISVYRTDQLGTIIAESDGNSIKFNVEPGNYSYDDKKRSAEEEPGLKLDATETNSNEKSYADVAGNGQIKGNINSKGQNIYHMPDGAYYDQVIAEKWFKTEKEAQAAGFRRSKR